MHIMDPQGTRLLSSSGLDKPIRLSLYVSRSFPPSPVSFFETRSFYIAPASLEFIVVRAVLKLGSSLL